MNKQQWRIENDIPEPDAPHWLGWLLVAAIVFWGGLALVYVTGKALFWALALYFL